MPGVAIKSHLGQIAGAPTPPADQTDLHMHPRWVIGYLTERCPNTQFIVTAHSPLVVQAAANASIVELEVPPKKAASGKKLLIL